VNQQEDLRDINNLILSYLKRIARYGHERVKVVDDENEHNGLRE